MLKLWLYLLTYSMKQSSSWEANWSAAGQEIPRIFMEPEDSSPHSQAHATCPYPELAPSSPHTHIPSIFLISSRIRNNKISGVLEI